MSRSGYDGYNGYEIPQELWDNIIHRSINGKRGQNMLRDLLAALDAMPNKRLISDDLIRDGEVCAIGALGLARGVDIEKLDPSFTRSIAKAFGIAPAMVQEIEYQNDDRVEEEAPEQRWERMRHWVASQIKPESADKAVAEMEQGR
jgi:hypothetical protein